ncbi:phosphoribosylamine--glycine ligase [Haloferax mediterranei ATCC 33500]|uniref:Phosphoribosylamine--glycine ligase n=1 Tax=Haloferax mediterranei (strain ATCC 33500 / DSM 1411 / JCM 8866 / NBRC 14739 / NCIMB 2177 / R-4) TaxID=523841 RepID=I3R5E5_HALMT|nr:phosphoribosylamine--glycine ligase [Haloferax mediterranei]AFK19455.1 phosphoribosylamine--glycine ligase [Haloferax mediterranei ATCC 33500]AHZ21199.1 phosphoribosylamine--glycine ligase [Haloferax mediterranei ATCC 33500]EMA04358.1 phosphoribosylamine--glycine ligase [Haloferax mediterranei ATCC 33500]MDX5989557.1 phosphoribosylamine--glycine ligase [Haloferax mediterranei ATCC 33500]QCQ75915.1 phosphoribosylamine--glycine ligase [Haloferax mediterranei ATCC 33500]
MSETVLLVGGGGREHAIARALAPDCDLYACASNRNPGIADLADGFETVSETAADDIVAYAESVDATLAIVGPESGLAAGVSDALDAAGIYTFGPQEAEARIETDKAFQRRFMRDEEIPGNPDFATFDDMEAACDYIDEYDGDLAVKPAGLTGGKGVKVIGDQVTPEEAKEYLRDSDYDRVVLEERLVGEEFTIQAFVANGEFRVSPAVQDHKRAYEGDEGPNTGGMGSYTDVTPSLPFMDGEDYDAAVEVIEAVVDAMPDYKGILYGQFMLTTEGPKVIEFNARFGDPEAMNTLPVLETPFLDVLVAAREGESLPELEFAEKATVCKYAVPEGYPTDPKAGAKIEVEVDDDAGALLFYASVDARDDGLYTTTSRSFAVVGHADSISQAEQIAEDALADAGEGFHIRHDIGTESLVQQRLDHMAELRGE